MTLVETALLATDALERRAGEDCKATAGIANGSGISAGPALDQMVFAALRRWAVLDGYKWDPQVGDVDVLAPFPLVMRRSVWEQLADQAEQLAAEAIAAEAEVAASPTCSANWDCQGRSGRCWGIRHH